MHLICFYLCISVFFFVLPKPKNRLVLHCVSRGDELGYHNLRRFVLFFSFIVAVDEIHNASTVEKFEISFPRKGDK